MIRLLTCPKIKQNKIPDVFGVQNTECAFCILSFAFNPDLPTRLTCRGYSALLSGRLTALSHA